MLTNRAQVVKLYYRVFQKQQGGSVMKHIILRFGKWQGWSLEQMMFSTGGYNYIVNFILTILAGDAKHEELVERAKVLVNFGEADFQTVIKCSCGKSVEYYERRQRVGSMNRWFNYNEGYCYNCVPADLREGSVIIPVVFSYLQEAKRLEEQRQFRDILQWLCGTVNRPMIKCFTFFHDNENHCRRMARQKK